MIFTNILGPIGVNTVGFNLTLLVDGNDAILAGPDIQLLHQTTGGVAALRTEGDRGQPRRRISAFFTFICLFHRTLVSF